MKVSDILEESITDIGIITKLLYESLDSPFPYTQLSPADWEIDVLNKGKLIVTIDQRKINGYDIASKIGDSSEDNTIDDIAFIANSFSYVAYGIN
jgi:hypothetical protein